MTPLASVHDPLSPRHASLDAIFAPRNVAVVGATDKEGSVGRTLLSNLIGSPFGGAVFPVNPKRDSVLGVKAYPSLSAIPDAIDLAVVVTPAPSVPGVMKECVAKGVRGAIVISAGFKEIGADGAALERQVQEEIRRGGIRLVGPNCLGVMSPRTGLNATFASTIARPGNVAFLSQSGALCTAVLDWSLQENVGFSLFASLGSMLDVSWGDLIEHLGEDPHTRSIIIYMETIGDARAFLSAAREVALTKPIIVIKPGRTEGAARAAASHTGSLTGSDEVLDAAFNRCGVLRVQTIAELFYMAEVLGKQPRPKGPRLTIVTNAGGPGVLATDSLILGGGELATLSKESMDRLNLVLPAAWSHGNPIDVLGDASPERYAQALEIAANDPESDGLLLVLTPQAMTDPTRTAEALRPYAHVSDRPILASWMGGTDVKAGEEILNRAGIPTFPYPDTAARVFDYMWRYTDNLRALYETPSLASEYSGFSGPEEARRIIAAVRSAQRTLLSELESKQVLAAYGIPTVATRLARSEERAVEEALAIGLPVVLKLHSSTLTHKTDVGGVALNLRDVAEVRQAYRSIERKVRERAGEGAFEGVTVQPMIERSGYELILGSSVDSQFGPVLLFGSGGTLVEVYKDRALALPPLNTTLARRMIERTSIVKALRGTRGRAPVDLGALERLLVVFSQLVVEHPEIREADINPLLASPEGLVALDARIVLHGPEVAADAFPRPAIRPYPSQYVANAMMKGSVPYVIRPIRPEDEPLLVRFHETLSERSVYLRYLQHLKLNQRIAHHRLARVCFIDYDREIVLVAERETNGERSIVGIARLNRTRVRETAEFALLIADGYQGQGLGRALLTRLLDVGRIEGIKRVFAEIAQENLAMQAVCRKLGFRFTDEPQEPTLRALIDL